MKAIVADKTRSVPAQAPAGAFGMARRLKPGGWRVRQQIVRKFVSMLLALAAAPAMFAQSGRAVLSGHMRPGVVAANDQGRVDASVTLRHVTLILQPSAAQQADLTAFLASQQDPSSPDFHHWLTPEQYGSRFGLADSNIAQITSWLASQNLTVDSVGRGRTTIAFTGAVRNVEAAFQTEIHNYVVKGEKHFANASEPSVPAGLASFVSVVHGLDDFHLKPRAVKGVPPVVNGASYTSVTTGNHFLAPQDVATIFDVSPLYNSAITGKGQTIAVVGQTSINLSDIEQFRSYFNLSANDPQLLLVPGTTNPGISSNDLPEADLDLEWSGAIARDASIVFVYSNDVETSLDYAVNENIAPVITMSYGLCEALSGNADLSSLNSFAQQASAQGISWIAAAGDNGANDCYGQANRAPSGLSVDAPASVPGVTGVGGLTLTEGSGTYWNTVNGANHESVTGYIPTDVWNDSVEDGTPSAGGGGASTYFAKPAWQTGTGVPTDGKRDVPDLAMPASADHDAYLVYTSGTLEAYGGTSVGAPVFAGITGLLNQYLQVNGLQTAAGSGSLNSRLYSLAAISPGAFHDVTVGNNMVVSCASQSCASNLVGFNATPGYDQASGLGSVDAFNLISAWAQTSTATKAEATVQLTSTVGTLTLTGSTVLTATVTSAGGATPTGTVTFYAAGVSLGSAKVSGAGLAAVATMMATAAQLSAGTPETAALSASSTAVTPEVTAIYSGDGVYSSGAATAEITIASPTAMVVSGITSAASFQKAFAPGMVVALFGQNLATSTPNPPASPLPIQLAGTTVTLNGIAAPLYYVSPTQINLQIPYAIPVNTTAIVKVTAGTQTATYQVFVTSNAPEIFADTNNLLVPYQTTARGQTIFMFATGDGLFTTPQVTTGAVPAAGTISVAATKASVTVGGVAATTTFVGEPSWSIGVSQINFTIPANAPTGLQPVVVTVGGVASSPVYITVQ